MLTLASFLLGIPVLGVARLQAAPVPRPEAGAGPYTVAVDRIVLTRNATTGYLPGRPPASEQRMSLQLHLGVYAPDRKSADRLALFQVSGLTVASGSRLFDVPHHGGMLESPGDPAAVRAYLFAQTFPTGAREVRALFGEIVAYERAGPLDFRVSLAGRTLPFTEEQGGVKIRVEEIQREGVWTRAVLSVEAPSSDVLLNTIQDGTYGISLLDAMGRAGTPNGSVMNLLRPNHARYRVAFQDLRGAPATLRLRLAYQGGQRKVYPFRLEHIPLPERPGPSPSAEQQ